ncbi:MAG: zinc ribbon domain-containing protein [Chloroflexi bacterium]|nr:zinc ribbon domain-containing protein [Chloroflexota bacterium]
MKTESRSRSVLSERLQTLMADVLAGNAPNAGRFCGYCYHPVGQETDLCPHCGRSTAEWAPVNRIPEAVFAMFLAQRSREGWVVRLIAYGGLLAGIVLSLLPIAFADVRWWTVLSLFVILGLSYVVAANLANTLGDAVGYRWGQAVLRRRWEEFVAARERPEKP